jgi:ferredoxin-NADP reductase
MHHMFPMVPYYRYNKAWDVARPLLRDTEIVWAWPAGRLPQPAEAPPSRTLGTIQARIVAIDQVAEGVRAYTLEPATEPPFPHYTPGAHISVQVAPGLVRPYSLTNAPRADGRYRIAIKREAEGRGGSRAAHESFSVGRVIEIGAPRNHFPLSNSDQRVQLIGGGIGVTPLLAMAEALHARGAEFSFHISAREPLLLPFSDELAAAPYADRVRLYFDHGSTPRKLMAGDLPRWSEGSALYLCGPRGFMAYVMERARDRGWPEHAMHTEHFVGVSVDRSANRPFTATLARSGLTLEVPADRSLLEVLQAHRQAVPASCVQGLCGTCVCKVMEGEVDHRDAVLSDEARKSGLMTPCVSRASGDRLILDL